jgi:hypothetical protein
MRPTDLLLVVAAVLAVVGAGMIYLPAGFITAAAATAALWWLFFDEVEP